MKQLDFYRFGHLLAVLLVCLGVSMGSAHASSLDDAVATLDEGRYTQARDAFIQLANQGEVKAQLLLGIMYNDAWGIPRDIHKARKWYKRAAQQGNADAQFLLGISYIDRYTDKQDSRRARYWIKRSAHNNHPVAQRFLIRAYEQGWFGSEPNLQYASYWQERIATVNIR